MGLIGKFQICLARFEDADNLWKGLRKSDNLPLARAVLSRLRQGKYLADALPGDKALLDELCRQEAMLTSKDPELSATMRHGLALDILRERSRNSDLRDSRTTAALHRPAGQLGNKRKPSNIPAGWCQSSRDHSNAGAAVVETTPR
jgi:hypothetical protein